MDFNLGLRCGMVCFQRFSTWVFGVGGCVFRGFQPGSSVWQGAFLQDFNLGLRCGVVRFERISTWVFGVGGLRFERISTLVFGVAG